VKTNKTNKYRRSPDPRSANGPLRCAVLRLILVAALLSPTLRLWSGAVDVGGKRHVDTMTVNLYLGAGTGPLLALNPSDPNYLANLVATVTGIYQEVVASQPAVRLQGVADEIASRRPEIVAVQEASLIRIQSPGDLVVGGTQPATQVQFDYLQILVDALVARGAPYAVVSAADELEVELPMLNLQSGDRKSVV